MKQEPPLSFQEDSHQLGISEYTAANLLKDIENHGRFFAIVPTHFVAPKQIVRAIEYYLEVLSNKGIL